jgi:hypothetical protein
MALRREQRERLENNHRKNGLKEGAVGAAGGQSPRESDHGRTPLATMAVDRNMSQYINNYRVFTNFK